MAGSQGIQAPRRPGLLPWGILVALLALVIGACVGILTDAPYNDDFAYLTSARWLHESGTIKFTNWQYMTLITQTLLGGAWTAIFGYSIHALRILTLLVWAGGTIILVRALRSESSAKTAILLAAVALNPMALVLATSFMTDLYYWTLILLAAWLFASGLETERRATLVAAWVALFLALFVRQVALPVAVAFVLADLLRNGFRRGVLARSVLPLLLAVAAYVLAVKVTAATIGLPSDFTHSTESLTSMVKDLMLLKLGALKPFFAACVLSLTYIGLFFLPLFLAGLVGMIRVPHARMVAAGTLLIGLALFASIALLQRPIPSPGNLINLYGIGPRSDWRLLGGPVPPLWWAITALAALSGAFLVSVTLSALAAIARSGGWAALRGQWRPLMFIAAAIFGNAPLMLGYSAWFDRHLMAMMGLLGIGCLSLLQFRPVPPLRAALPLGVALLGVLLSLALLHDFGAWQRATMLGHHALVTDHRIAPEAIDGGFEMSNYFLHAAARVDQPAPELLKSSDIKQRRCQVTDLPPQRQAWPLTGVVPIRHLLPFGPDAVYFHCGPETSPPVAR